MATTTFYAGAGDGWTIRTVASGEGWSTMRGATGTGASHTDAAHNFAGCRCYSSSNTWEWIERSFFPFDTSALTSGVVISSADFAVKGTAKASTIDHKVVLDKTTPASTSSLATTDYELTHHDCVKQSDTEIACSTWSTSGFNVFALNATGLGNINKTGVTEFGGKILVDFSDTTPTWSNAAYSYVQCYFSEQTGTTSDPYLSVTYSTDSGPANVKTVNGLAKASVKTVNGLAMASVKSINGLT